jgi:hypothetical protein
MVLGDGIIMNLWNGGHFAVTDFALAVQTLRVNIYLKK